MKPIDPAYTIVRGILAQRDIISDDYDFVNRELLKYRALVLEEAEKIAEGVAEAHRQITPQGRFTKDYREGASDAAQHVAHLLREARSS